jgi:hypothetical protein
VSAEDCDEREALFVDDRELRRRINPKLGWDRFRATVRIYEARRSPGGLVFPRLSPSWGGRYFPSVLAYFDDLYRNGHHDAAEIEGPEDFNATARQKARLQTHRQDRPPLLDSSPGQARPDGVSGRVHRIAARR